MRKEVSRKKQNGNKLYHKFSVNNLEAKEWDEQLADLIQEMDIWEIDITSLAENYRNYIISQDSISLEIYGKMVWTLSFILRTQANQLSGNGDQHPDQELQSPAEIAHWEDWEPDMEEETISMPENVDFPVKRMPKRRISLDDLKSAFRKAVILGKEKYTKTIQESTINIGFEMDVKNITDRLKETYQKLKRILSGEKGKASFQEILSSHTKEEKIDKFLHLLHLESENKIRCEQRHFLGDIEIELTDN